jgi:hypothetical protein
MREEKVFIPSNGIQLEDFLSNHKGLIVKGGVIFTTYQRKKYTNQGHWIVFWVWTLSK